MLRGPERKVSLFSAYLDEEGHLHDAAATNERGEVINERGEASPRAVHFYDLGDEDWERSGGFAGDAADLLAGGGFHVE
jgi:hypothetical protein